jgi:hypothetical protein
LFHRAVTRFLVLIVSSWLFPCTVGAADNGRTIQVGHLGENIQPFVQMSTRDGRMSAVPYVIVSGSATPGRGETPNGKPDPIEEAVARAGNARTSGKIVAAALPDEKKAGARIGGMVSGTEEVSYTKVSGILRNLRKTVKKNRQKRPVEESIETVKEVPFPGPFSMAR